MMVYVPNSVHKSEKILKHIGSCELPLFSMSLIAMFYCILIRLYWNCGAPWLNFVALGANISLQNTRWIFFQDLMCTNIIGVHSFVRTFVIGSLLYLRKNVFIYMNLRHVWMCSFFNLVSCICISICVWCLNWIQHS